MRDRVNAGLDTRLELRQSEGGLPEARQQIEALQEQAALAAAEAEALFTMPSTETSQVGSADDEVSDAQG